MNSHPQPRTGPAADSTRNTGRFRPPTVDDPHVVASPRITPPERLDARRAWRFSDLASACPVAEVDAEHRLEPYWGDLWSSGSQGSWFTPERGARMHATGVGRVPKALMRRAHDEALEAFKAPRGWRDRLGLLGALFSWRTMTTQQAAAIVGQGRLARVTGTDTASGFASGLIDLGVFTGWPGTGLTGREALLRLSDADVFPRDLTDWLTWPEWVAVTGGQSWRAPTSYDRHNVLATELALRWAEYADIGTVLGERFSTHDLLAGTGLGRDEIPGEAAADFTVVRPDGMRIAVELTTHATPGLPGKIRRWARLLHERPFSTSGLCVVFVAAPHPRLLGDSKGHRARAKIYKQINASSKEFPGRSGDRVAERIGVASWREWFPAAGAVSEAFLAMRVDRPTGREENVWEPCDMLNPADRPFQPAEDFDATAVLDNSALLGQTPCWLREKYTPPQLWRMMLEDAGVAHLHTAATPLPRMLGLW